MFAFSRGMYHNVATTLLLVLLCGSVSKSNQSEMFTGNVHMQRALYAEYAVARELRNYVAAERARMDAIEKIADDYDRHSSDALTDPDSFVANPVNAYLLIKRFTVDWNRLAYELFNGQSPQEFIRYLHNFTGNFPDQDDLSGSALALLRLQDTYELSTDRIASGDLTAVKSRSMNADDCFQLGVVAYNGEDWYHTILWMTKALELEMNETVKTADKRQILDYLSYSTYKQGNIEHAYNLTLEWLKLEPHHRRAQANLKYYTDMTTNASELLRNQSYAIKNEPIRTEFRSSEDFKVYERLCRGEKTHNIDERQLTCQFRRHHPMFYINPLLEEVISIKPRIVIYHKIMTDAEIEAMISLATPKLRRSGVFQLSENDNPYSDYRTSQSAWIDDYEHPLMAQLSERAKAFSNLTLDTVELFQVLNYGIGGQYEPHYDFARPTEINTFEEWRGNRIATVIFYMSDVEAGGRTVFNAIGVGAAPEKGSCIVWYNLLKNGQGDYDTRHAGCPVLAGNKWGS